MSESLVYTFFDWFNKHSLSNVYQGLLDLKLQRHTNSAVYFVYRDIVWGCLKGIPLIDKAVLLKVQSLQDIRMEWQSLQK